MTYRDRRLAKADKLDEWSEKNEVKSTERYEKARAEVEHIPLGQPILVDHYSARRHRGALDRADRNMGAAVELDKKARDQAARSEGIRAAADQAIYDDDPDAIERLTEKLAGLEAKREGIKLYNKTARKGAPDTSQLDAKWLARADGNPFPAYALGNLSGVITTTRKRLERLTARKAATGTTAKPAYRLPLKYGGTCRDCGATLEKGTWHYYDRSARELICSPCQEGEAA